MIDNLKILIPKIRSLIPKLVAQDIVGVQPMDGKPTVNFNRKYWPYQIKIPGTYMPWDAERFCYQHFRSRNWRSYGFYFAFKREEDFAWFMLNLK